MTRLLLLAAAIGFGVSGATACEEYLRSAEAQSKQTVVASADSQDAKKMSTATEAQAAADAIRVPAKAE